MSHVTYEGVMSRIHQSCHVWMSHVMYAWVLPRMNQSCHIQIHHVLVSVHRSLVSVNRFLVCLDIFFLYLSPISLVISLFTITHRPLSSVLLPCLFCVWNDLVFFHGSLCVILGVLLLSCDLSFHYNTSPPSFGAVVMSLLCMEWSLVFMEFSLWF